MPVIQTNDAVFFPPAGVTETRLKKMLRRFPLVQDLAEVASNPPALVYLKQMGFDKAKVDNCIAAVSNYYTHAFAKIKQEVNAATVLNAIGLELIAANRNKKTIAEDRLKQMEEAYMFMQVIQSMRFTLMGKKVSTALTEQLGLQDLPELQSIVMSPKER